MGTETLKNNMWRKTLRIIIPLDITSRANITISAANGEILRVIRKIMIASMPNNIYHPLRPSLKSIKIKARKTRADPVSFCITIIAMGKKITATILRILLADLILN
jgi:hypothetical protein